MKRRREGRKTQTWRFCLHVCMPKLLIVILVTLQRSNDSEKEELFARKRNCLQDQSDDYERNPPGMHRHKVTILGFWTVIQHWYAEISLEKRLAYSREYNNAFTKNPRRHRPSKIEIGFLNHNSALGYSTLLEGESAIQSQPCALKTVIYLVLEKSCKSSLNRDRKEKQTATRVIEPKSRWKNPHVFNSGPWFLSKSSPRQATQTKRSGSGTHTPANRHCPKQQFRKAEQSNRHHQSSPTSHLPSP